MERGTNISEQNQYLSDDDRQSIHSSTPPISLFSGGHNNKPQIPHDTNKMNSRVQANATFGGHNEPQGFDTDMKIVKRLKSERGKVATAVETPKKSYSRARLDMQMANLSAGQTNVLQQENYMYLDEKAEKENQDPSKAGEKIIKQEASVTRRALKKAKLSFLHQTPGQQQVIKSLAREVKIPVHQYIINAQTQKMLEAKREKNSQSEQTSWEATPLAVIYEEKGISNYNYQELILANNQNLAPTENKWGENMKAVVKFFLPSKDGKIKLPTHIPSKVQFTALLALLRHHAEQDNFIRGRLVEMANYYKLVEGKENAKWEEFARAAYDNIQAILIATRHVEAQYKTLGPIAQNKEEIRRTSDKKNIIVKVLNTIHHSQYREDYTKQEDPFALVDRSYNYTKHNSHTSNEWTTEDLNRFTRENVPKKSKYTLLTSKNALKDKNTKNSQRGRGKNKRGRGGRNGTNTSQRKQGWRKGRGNQNNRGRGRGKNFRGRGRGRGFSKKNLFTQRSGKQNATKKEGRQ